MSKHDGKPVEIAEGVYWLSFGLVAGNVYFVRSESSWVLIDASVEKRGRLIRQAAEDLFGPGATPAAILLTHVHPDHSGSAPELARAWGCPVYVHPEELPLAVAEDLETVERFANPMDRWIILPIMRALSAKRVEAILSKQSLAGMAQALEPEAEVPGLPGWTCIATPGHAPGHVVFWRSRDRVLISGDAVLAVDVGSLRGLLRWLLGPGKPRIARPPRFLNRDHHRAIVSLTSLARLDPAVLATGHGPPMIGDLTAQALRSYVEGLGVDEV